MKEQQKKIEQFEELDCVGTHVFAKAVSRKQVSYVGLLCLALIHDSHSI